MWRLRLGVDLVIGVGGCVDEKWRGASLSLGFGAAGNDV